MKNAGNKGRKTGPEREETVTISRRELESLRKEIQDRDIQINELKQELKLVSEKIELLTEQLRLGRHNRFVSTTEKTKSMEGQLSFFNEAESSLTPAEYKEITETTQVKAHTRKKDKKKRTFLLTADNLPKGVPVDVVDNRLEEKDRICSDCGSVMEEIGKETRYELVIIPSQVRIRQINDYKYVCPVCREKDSDERTVIVEAEKDELLKGSHVSSEAGAYLMWRKYVMSLPLYRMEQDFERSGLRLSRQTMSNWMIRLTDMYLLPILGQMHKELLKEDILHRDETTLKVIQEIKDSKRTTGYMWLYRTGRYAEHPMVLYEYRSNRGGENAEKFLKGFKGYLHTDGYTGYNAVKDIQLVGCWAHRRRGFADAVKRIPKDSKRMSIAREGLEYCNRLFDIEEEISDLPPEDIHRIRKERAVPVLEEFREWLEDRQTSILAKSNLGRAIDYTLKRWDVLNRYLMDGRLEISNNRAERSIKPFVIGRKNFLFSNTTNGAEKSAAIYSITQTAIENGLNPYEYLKYIFDVGRKIDMEDEEAVKNLLPWNAPEGCRVKGTCMA